MVIAVPLLRERRERPGTYSSGRAPRAPLAESSRPRTASHNSGVKRPSTEVRTRKSRVSRRERRQNLGGQIVADMPSAAGERPHPAVGFSRSRSHNAARYRPAGQPSVRSASKSTLSPDSSMPSLTISSRASSTVKASSRARISVSALLARRFARPTAGLSGSIRAARPCWKPLDRVVDQTKRRLAADRVEVVEHDRHRTAVRRPGRSSARRRRSHLRTPDAEAHQRPPSETLTEPVHGRRQVRPQPHRIIVSRIKRHPDHGLRALDTPRPQERRLAVADRRVEQRQRRSAVIIEHIEQARPAQHPSVNPGQHQLRLDHPQPLTSYPRFLGAHRMHPPDRPFPTPGKANDSTRSTVTTRPSTRSPSALPRLAASISDLRLVQEEHFLGQQADTVRREPSCAATMDRELVSLLKTQPPARSTTPSEIAVRHTLARRR